MDNKKFIEIISQFCSNIREENNKVYFEYDGLLLYYSDKKFYTVKNLFTSVPHILDDNCVCLYGNTEVWIQDDVGKKLVENIIKIYIPWLISLPSPIKVFEFLGEIDYYIKTLFHFNINKVKLSDNDIVEVMISTPCELWEFISSMKEDIVYYLYSPSYKKSGIYLKKCNRTRCFCVDFNNEKKAMQRVNGLDFNECNLKCCFIGVGSVNSYLIKSLLSRGLNDIVAIDGDKFEVGNLFRFAFPYKNKSKVDCLKKFCSNLSNIKLDCYYNFVTDKFTVNVISGCEYIFVSVDSFNSWFNIIAYLKNYAEISQKIILLGIDAFGNYGKYVIVQNDASFVEKTIEFLTKKLESKLERTQLIPNGCGKSLAIYGEKEILKLCDEVMDNLEYDNEVKIVEFNN